MTSSTTIADTEFFAAIEEIAVPTYRKFLKAINDLALTVTYVDILLPVSDEFRSVFSLSNDISIKWRCTGVCKTIYVYGGIELKPDGYYIRPEGCQEVSTLQILHEAMRQDRYDPDIKHLQMPE